MTKTPNRSSLSRRVLQAASSFKAMLFRSLFRSSIYESIRPVLSGRMGWLQTLSSLIGRGSENIHKGGVLRVSAKERAKRSAAREFRRRFVMAEQLELRALMAADLGLDPTLSQQPVAAEVGSMVPGQFAASPIQASNGFFSVAAEGTSYLADMNLAAGVEQATQRLSAFAQRGDYTATMQEVFGRTGMDASALRSTVSDLQAQWTSGDLGVRVEILSGQSMSGGLGAYAADYQGSPVIFINGDWLASNPGADAVAKVLIEEFGHSLDRRINSDLDSPGDEGELFANRLVEAAVGEFELLRILNESDAGTLQIGNVQVKVEFFNFNTLTFTENGNSLATTTNAQFLANGSNQGDYNNTATPLTIEVNNVKDGDYLTFNSSGITSFPATFSVDLNTVGNVGITQIGSSGIYYSTTRTTSPTNKTTLLFSGATTTDGVSKANCDALMDVAKFISISQHPSRGTNPTIAVRQGATAVSNPATAAITVSSANDAPVINTAINPTLTSVSGTVGAPVNGSAVSRSNSTLISSLISGVSDVDELPLFGIAIVGLSSTTNGTLWYTTDDGAAWTRVEPDPVNNPISGTSALLLEDTPATRLYWQPATNAAFTGNVLTFRAWDQSGTTASFNNGTRASVGNAGTPTNTLPNNTNPYSVQTDTIAVTVTAVSNSAPVLDASQSPTLSALNEDTAAPANGTNSNSTLVSALVGGITDANGADPKGIAITAVNTTNGSLRYSLDNGANWSAVGTVSNTSALLLPSNVSNARLQFVPNTDFNGTITDVLTFRAWDQTSGTAGNKVDTSSNGGTTAFSTATDTVTMVVNAVNDAPVASSGSASLTAINEDATSPTGSTVSALFNGNFDDSKDAVTGGSSANTLAGVAITAYTEDAAKGTWQYSSDGTTWTTISTTTAISNTSALTLLSTDSLRFLPASNFNGAAPTLTVRLLETPRSITTGARIDASTNGGTTTISSGTVVLSHTVNAVNDAPTFTGTIGGTYTEAGTALAFLSSAAVADVDASNFNGGSVTVSLGAYQTGDVLSINNQGTGAGQIGISGGNVTYQGGTIGTFSGGSASNLIITFNSTNATAAAVQALMGQLRFSSTSNNPTNFGNATTRTATVTLNDGGNTGTGGAQSASVSGTINVSGVNSAPTVTAPGSFSVTEDVASNLVYTGTPFADVDSANLTVTLSVDDGTISGALATGITIGGTATARTFAGTVSDLNTYFTTAGNITYTTAANNTTQRTLTTSVSDGFLSNSATSNINITAVNDAPTLTAGGTLAYTENEAAKVIDSTITVNDVDNTSLKGGTVTISAGLTSGDLLGFSAQNGITGLYNSTTGVLTLTGTASLANYQTALRSVTYRSTSPDPTGTSATRTISWRVDDGSASSNLSNIATSTINITPILSAPRVDLNGVLDGTDTLVDYTQGSAVLLASGGVITDDDGGNGMASLVITLTNPFSGDVLTMGSVSGLQSNYTAGVLTITPVAPATTATLALFQQALRTVAFNNSTNSPNLTERVIQVQATDAGSVLGNVAVARVSMTDTNDAPVYQNNLVNQTPSVGLPFSYSLPGSSGVSGSVFVDPENQAMTYQAYVASSTAANATLSPLPGWLTFNSSLMRFYGVAPTNQSLIIRLVATDTEGLSNYGNFTISPKITLNESGTEKFFSYVSFPRVFDLVEGANYDNAGFYQEETNSFKTASAPLAGSNFIFYQSTFQAGEDPAFFNGNNVAGTLSYLNTSGQVVNIVGVASRPIKTSGNNTRGFYMWVPDRNQAFGKEGAILLVIDANYFANSTVYNSSSDRVDSDLNAYRDQNVVSIASASANESAGTISFVITRTGTSVSGTASVRYTTSIASTDTASSADFTSKSDLATFASGETSKTVTVSLVNDTLYETDETFTVTLSDALNSRLGLAVATGTIIDNDPVPSVSIANAANIEGNKITFTVTRTGDAQAVQSVRYATTLSTTAPIASLDDFTSTSGTVTFNPGETTKTFTVQTTQDELLESNEIFLVNLSNPTGGLTIGTAQATGTIKDDESTVFYYVDPPTPTVEGTGIQFVIRRTGTVQNIDFSNANLPDVGQSITYWTSIRSSDNSESADFAGISSGTPASITFGANDRSVTVTVNTTNDSLYEGDETFGFFLGNPATLLAGNSTATETNPDGDEVTATILDDDAAPKFSVVVGSPSSVVEGNPITFVITRDADSEQPQSIDYSTVIRASDSTAINDFTAKSGTLTFNPGEFGSGSAKTVTVTTTLDSVTEGPETFGFAISNPTGGAQLDPTKTEATGTLLDANTAPTASNTTVGTVTKPALEDIPYVFGEFDFGYNDGENAPLWSIQIKTLPKIGDTLTGELQKATSSTPDGIGGTTLGGWTPVAVDDVLTISGPLGIGAGALRYVPPSNANNQNLPSAPIFSVRVSDGVNFSSDSPTTNRGTVTINITPVNDAPAGTDVAPPQSAYVGGFITLTESQFIMSDSNDNPEENNFLGVVFTDVPERPNPTATPPVQNRGALQVQVGENSTSRTGNIPGARDIRTSAFSQSTTAGTPQFVTAESGSWTFSNVTYDKRLMGRYGIAYLESTTGNYRFEQYTNGSGGFEYVARYTGTSAPFTPEYEALNIPTGTMVSDGFLFDVGQNGTDFFRRTLTFTLTGTGSGFNFQSNVWKTVVDGEFVPKATITGEKLRYSPCFCGVARYTRDGSFQLTATAGIFTTIKFQVQDDGGTANGGVDLDPTPNDLPITLIDGFTPVLNVPGEQYFNEDTTLSFNAFGEANALYVTYAPPSGPVNDLVVVVELDSRSRPGTLSLDGNWPSGVTATNDGAKIIKYQIEGNTAFVNLALAALNFTPDADQFSTTDLGAQENPRYPGLNGIGGTDAYAILKVSARNKPESGQMQYPSAYANVDMSVLNVNDAPVVVDPTATLPEVFEDNASPTISTISDIFSDSFSDSKDFSPNTSYVTNQTLAGIAVRNHSPDTTKGSWQYSELGTSWTNLPARSNDDSNAFALPASYRLRFLPAANYNGSVPSLTVRLIESSSTPVTVGSLNVSTNGDTTRFSSGTVVLSASVTAVNDAPVASGTASLAPINEDDTTTTGTTPPGALVSSLFSGNFSDAVDNQTANGGSNNINTLAGIAVTAYNASTSRGVWQYNNGSGWNTLASVSSSSAATVIPEGSSLRFVPAANFNGSAPTITAVLIDSSSGSVNFATGVNLGTTGGVTQYSASTVVLSHLVTAVNDAPVANGIATLAAVLEDTAEPTGATVASLFTTTFSDVADNILGGSTANTLVGIAIRSYVPDTSKGLWQYSTNGGSTWTTISAIDPANDVSALALKNSDLLRFKPATDYNSSNSGAVPALVARLIESSFGSLTTGLLNVSSNGGSTSISSGLVTLGTTVTSVNDRPTSANQSITTLEDTPYTLATVDFGFGTSYADLSDSPNPNNFVKIIVAALPGSGTLWLNGQAVQTNASISIRDIQDGKLTYQPASNVNGLNVAGIGFKVRDDGGVVNGGGQDIDTSSATYTVTINITAVNDAPTSANFSVTTNEDTNYTFSSGVFPFADAVDAPSGNSLQSVVITSLPSVGSLTLSNVAVVIGQEIPVASLGNLVFSPTANTNGDDYAKIGFKVKDNGGTSNTGVDLSTPNYTVTINVTPVNDQPLATGNATLATAFKNTPNLDGVTVSSLFGSLYSDPFDQPNPNTLTGVAITDLTHDATKGTWEYQPAAGGAWTPLDGSISSAASLTLKSADRLRFVPTNNYVGAAPQITVRLIENVTPTTGGNVNLSGSLSPSSNYSSNTSTLNHQVKGGLLVKGLSDVSEGTPAIFTVSFDALTTDTIALSLDNNSNSTQSGDYTSVFNSTNTWDNTKVNVYYLSGSTKVVMAAPSGSVNISTLDKFYVSVPTGNDSVYEGPESFGLSASMTDSTSSRDTSTILDNGRGVEYNDDATPKSSYTADNDLLVNVTAITPVNEGSDYAFFTVEGSSGDSLQLAVSNVSTGLVNPRIEYALVSTTSAADWTVYDGGSNIPAVPGAIGTGTGMVYVRVSIVSEQDDTYEGAETFTLTATSVVNSVRSDIDTSTIIDNGTGKKFGPNLTNGSPNESTANLDDDRALMVVPYAPVNEGSTFHMFKVTGPAGAVLDLELEAPSSGVAATFGGFTFQYSTDKTGWTTYNPSGSTRPTLPSGGVTGDLFVRVNITTELDDPYEGSEKFVLKATTLAGRIARGTGEILDDGTGGLYTGAWGTTDPTTTTGQLEDDRLWAVNDRVSSSVIPTVTIQVRSNDQAVGGVTISDEIDLDPSTPNVVDSQLVVAGQGTWNVVNGNVTYTRLTTYYADPSPITYAIRPTDRTNFSKRTATIDVDFPVVTRPDFNVPAPLNTVVTIPVLANDSFGDTPVGSTLRFVSNNGQTLVVPGEGTWSIDPATYAVSFTPLSTFTGDPTPQSYVVRDFDGNLSNPTLITVTYERTSKFVVQINDSYQTNATGFDVVVVDNVRATNGIYPTIELATGVFVTPNRDDADLTVGRIGWSGAVGRFTRIQVDAKSKPLTSGTMADISLVSTATSTTGGNVEIRASDMGYSLAAGTYTLASPIAGTNNGTLWFSETVGLLNQPFTAAADPTSVSNSSSNASPVGGLTNRSLSWNGTRQITLGSAALVSLTKSVKIVHATATRTTQTTAGGKLVETSQEIDLSPYINWVLPGAATSLASPAASKLDEVLVSVECGGRFESNFNFEKSREFQPIFVGGNLKNDGIFMTVPSAEDDILDASGPVVQGLRRSLSRLSNSRKA